MTDHELRVLVLTKVMGVHIPDADTKIGMAVDQYDRRDPTQDLNAAFAALEAFVQSKGGRTKCYFSIGMHPQGWSVFLTWQAPPGSQFREVVADTLPLAICKALAKAIGGGE